MIKVLIADSVALLRNGLKTLIEKDKDIKVVGSASDGKETLRLCKDLIPDVALLDLTMPYTNGAEIIKLIKETSSKTMVIVLTVCYNEELISEAIRLGTDGYILKDLGQEELIGIIKNINTGLKVFHHDILVSLRKQCIYKSQYKNKDKSNLNISKLSTKELDLIKFIIEGKKNREIAKQMFIAEGSVKNMTSRILRKLNIEDRTQLAIYAVKNFLI